jgi:hypothetical protein
VGAFVKKLLGVWFPTSFARERNAGSSTTLRFAQNDSDKDGAPKSVVWFGPVEIEAEKQPQVLRLPFATLRVAQDDRSDWELYSGSLRMTDSFILTGEQGTAPIVQAAEIKIQGEMH